MSVSCHIAHSHQIESTNTKLDTIDASLQTIDTSISGISSDATAANQVIANGHLSDIKTAVEVIDNAISGTEMQVDIVSAPTLTVDASGTTVPVSGTFWQTTQPISGTVTANLSSTDNAVLDSIDSAVNGVVDVDVTSAITESPTQAFGSNDYSAGWANNASTTAVDMNAYRTFSFAQALPNTSLGSETLVLEGSTDNVSFYHIEELYPSIATDSGGSSAYAWNVSYSDLPFRYVRVTNRSGSSIACSGPAMYHRSN